MRTGVIYQYMDTNQQALQAFIENVEQDLLAVIQEHLAKGTLPLEQAQEVAREFLSLLPVHDKTELLLKLSDLGKKYAEAQAVYLKYAAPEDEAMRQTRLTAMSEHIKEGRIEEALKIAKGET
jgi:hypothetical protein